jgi:hypothetical protein
LEGLKLRRIPLGLTGHHAQPTVKKTDFGGFVERF